jgi:hypothetical protein
VRFSYPRASYLAKPFPHAVIEGAWDAGLIRDCKTEAESYKHWVGGKDGKYLGRHDLPEAVSAVIHEASGDGFIPWLEELTGERGLCADPGLFGAGLHRTKRDGLLRMHVDFNFHPQLKLYRRLNVLIFLNPDWLWSWGGCLELHGDGTKVIQPRANTMVVFTTDDKSYHGHPGPLLCPDNVSRDSIALYYYSETAPAGFQKREQTLYRG